MKIHLRKTDTLFSDFIKERDKRTCQRCGTVYPEKSKGFACSHYWGRAHEGTRFEPDNCIALCYGCHRIWGHGEGRDKYKEFMTKKLGERRMKTMEVQSVNYKKRDDKMDLLYIKKLMETASGSRAISKGNTG